MTSPRERLRPESDGRVRRGERNRAKILDAVLELVRAGDLLPTAERVARQAAVGTRTVFRHFDDMETLLAEMSRRVEADVAPFLQPDTQGGLAERARALVGRRVALYEHLAPYLRSGDLLRWRSKFLQANRQRMVRRLRSDLLTSLPELSRREPALLDALELATSFEAWDRLRSDQRLGRERAQATLTLAVSALLERR